MQRTISPLLALLIGGITVAAERPFDTGLAALHSGDLDSAISQFTEDIRLHPENGAAYDNRGFAYLQKGQVDKAIADFNVPIRMRPDDAHPYRNRAHAYEQKGDLSRAIADYSCAIELDPNRADDYNNRGAIYGTQRQWDKAIADFDAAIQKNPKLVEAYVNRGMAYDGKGEVAKSLTDFEEALRIKQGDPEVIRRLSLFNSAKKRHEPSPLITTEDIEKIALSHPAPEYPIEARRRRQTGRGVFELSVSESTGEVSSVAVITSTGYPVLDRAAIESLKNWKFKAHTVIRVKVPVTFSMPSKSKSPNQKT
jgi:TonB family protein